MIKYTLKCKNGHEFESWLSSSKSFDKLRKQNQLECPICCSNKIEINQRMVAFEHAWKPMISVCLHIP